MKKTIKDPIYGYVEIEQDIANTIVDTATFQRLRNIRQTSYAPVYPSTLHNRFVHSVGVYHLATLAINALDDGQFAQGDKEDFLLACLLHDVGHAPFSHTGEKFYDRNDMTEQLRQKTGLDDKNAASHEIMSVLIAIQKFSDKINDLDFFSRCITGNKYSSKQPTRNALISLLNSDLIDLDKLDYLIRDSFTSGFNSVSIDYVRFIKGLKCIDGEIVFYKSALSVIENIIFAHDSERKWIQSHPVILYEQYVLEKGISLCIKQYPKLLSEYSLTEDGHKINSAKYIRLLTDDDVVYIMKNELFDSHSIVKEYFIRSERRHPIWKSEAEYNALFSIMLGSGTSDEWSKMVELLKDIEINENSLDVIKKEIEEYSKLQQTEDVKDSLTQRVQQRKWLNLFKDFANDNDITFDFIFILNKKFNSNFAKQSLLDLKLQFPDAITTKPKKVSDVLNLLQSDSQKEKVLFYLYHKSAKSIKAADLADAICQKISSLSR
jgi:HD superfamily phosphohydrolase